LIHILFSALSQTVSSLLAPLKRESEKEANDSIPRWKEEKDEVFYRQYQCVPDAVE